MSEIERRQTSSLDGSTATAMPDAAPAQASDGLVGQMISDRYRVESLLGQGGMGAVYLVEHVLMRKRLALKVLHAEMVRNPEIVARFEREAMAAAHIDHPNVAAATDFGRLPDGAFFLVLEYVEGTSLAAALRAAAFSPERAIAIARQIASAMVRAHELGIIHRDLKPDNVMLVDKPGARDVVKVLDFGIAKLSDGVFPAGRTPSAAAITRAGSIYGTPEYMAPEQALGERVDARSDLYALGAILYEMLTGRPPFRGKNAVETQRQVIEDEPTPPSRLNAMVPRDLETICLKCLHKEPHLRYADAAALAADLHHFLGGEAIAARPEGRLARLVRRVRRRPVQSTLVAAVTLLTAALLGGGLWLISDGAAAARKIETEQAATERAADTDLREMVQWMRKASWPEARNALERAKSRLG